MLTVNFADGGSITREESCPYSVVMWNDEMLGDLPAPYLWFRCSDAQEAVRIAAALTDEDRQRGVPEEQACLFWALDENGGYLGGDTWKPDRPKGVWPLARVLRFPTERRKA